MTPPIRVLVVDDSVVIRRLLSTIIDEDPDLEVAGIAQNGRIGLERIEALKPDIVTLDVEMPELDGLQTLKELRKTNMTIPVVMFSTLTERGATATLDALSFGASDYVAKPANVGSVTVAMERVREDLIPKLKALVSRGSARTPAVPVAPVTRSIRATERTDVLAIGSSTGGPNALATVLESLPGNLGVPVVVTQHMPPVFTKFLAQRLDGNCELTVHEGEPGMRVEPNHVYIAPGDFHMTLRRRGLHVQLETNQDDQVNFCRPSVDVMFDAVAGVYGGNVLSVILTGMGADGRDGCKVLRELGSHVIVQDEATSVVWGMPGAVATAGLADEVLGISTIAAAIARRIDLTRSPLVQRTA
jgi:two-component system chemotaxis response regulator CheB